MQLPAAFTDKVRGTFGAAGERWLADLPAVLAEIAGRWSLTLGRPYELSYHYVVAATRADGTPAVLKLGVPGNEDFRHQVTMLRLIGGDGLAAVLAADAEAGALLLERVEPGDRLTPAGPQDDPAATAVLLGVLRRLHRPAPAATGLPTLADWAANGFGRLRARHGGGTGPLPADLVAAAERTWADLLAAPAGDPVLLHGDLHHENVLRSHRAGWLAIDPHGVIGEPAFEVGPLLLNPWSDVLRWPDPGRVFAARVDQLAAGLGVAAERVRRWGFAFAVLSAVWSDEGGGPADEHSLACARLLAAL